MTPEQQQQLAKAVRRATLLTHDEWRTVHNALSLYQIEMKLGTRRSAEVQVLMDKIRDEFIALESDVEC